VEHLAIDLGSRESQVCIRNEKAEIVLETQIRTRVLPDWLKSRPPSRVVIEASAEAFAVADGAIAAGHEVRVVPTQLVRALGVGARGIKNDKRDARALSETSCRIDVPTVHIPAATSRYLKALTGARETLVESRTKCMNGVHSWLRTQLLTVGTSKRKKFPDAVRKKLLDGPNGLPDFIEGQLKVIESMTEQIGHYDQQIRDLAELDPICVKMMTMPGVGPITALRFRAALDEIERFKGSHAVGSYLGLAPGENSSSQRKRRTGITKAGPARVRRVLVQAAWTLLRVRPNDPVVRWAKKIAERRGHKVAVVALARKLSGILYAMWRDNTTYDPTLAANV
jgi:transposase